MIITAAIIGIIFIHIIKGKIIDFTVFPVDKDTSYNSAELSVSSSYKAAQALVHSSKAS